MNMNEEKPIYILSCYCDYATMPKEYNKVVILPDKVINECDKKLYLDNRGIIYDRKFLDKNLNEDSFKLFNTNLVKKLKRPQVYSKTDSLISKIELLDYLRGDLSKLTNPEEVLYATEKLYRKLVKEFSFEEKKAREIYRNKLISYVQVSKIATSLLLTNYDKQRILKIKGEEKEIWSYKYCKKTFSIITTVYNKEKYINAYFNAINDLKYPNSKFEVIIVDDGSSDNSGSIEKKFDKTNINFKYIKTKNKGVSEARNLAIKYSKKEYLLFWDFDDTLSYNVLYDYNLFFQNYAKVGIVSCPIVIHEGGNKPKLHTLSKDKYISATKCSLINTDFKPGMYMSNVAGVALKRKLVKNTLFQSNLNFFEDTSWINKVIIKNRINEYGFMNDVSYDYKINNEVSLIKTKFADSEQIKLILHEYISFLCNRDTLSSVIVTLKSLNWFLSEALNSIEQKIDKEHVELLKHIARLIEQEDEQYLTSERVLSAILLLRGETNVCYQTYQINGWKIDYMLYKEIDDYIAYNHINPLSLYTINIGYEVKKYTKVLENIKRPINTILLMDRIFNAYDNAYYLYKYLEKKTDLTIYYALSEKSRDWNHIKEDKVNLVAYASQEYKELLTSVDCIISSHVDKFILNYGNLRSNIDNQTFIFLQHGVTTNDIKHWLFNKKIDYICSTYKFEEELLSEYYLDSQIIDSGMLRTDNLKNESNMYITYFASWSKYLLELPENLFIQSEYFKRLLDVFKSVVLNDIANENNLTIEVKIHPMIENKVEHALLKYGYNTSKNDYQSLISKSYISLTDFSSVIFDCLYTSNYCFFYNGGLEEYFCEKKMINRIDYNDFFIRRVKKLNLIRDYISLEETPEPLKNSCCDKFYEEWEKKCKIK